MMANQTQAREWASWCDIQGRMTEIDKEALKTDLQARIEAFYEAHQSAGDEQ